MASPLDIIAQANLGMASTLNDAAKRNLTLGNTQLEGLNRLTVGREKGALDQLLEGIKGRNTLWNTLAGKGVMAPGASRTAGVPAASEADLASGLKFLGQSPRLDALKTIAETKASSASAGQTLPIGTLTRTDKMPDVLRQGPLPGERANQVLTQKTTSVDISDPLNAKKVEDTSRNQTGAAQPSTIEELMLQLSETYGIPIDEVANGFASDPTHPGTIVWKHPTDPKIVKYIQKQ